MAKKKTTKKEIKANEKVEEVRLVELNLNKIRIPLKSKTHLLQDRMTEEVLKGIEDKQAGKTKSNKKKIRNFEKEAKEAIHKTSNGTIGFPVHGFKKGMIEAAARVGDRFFSKRLVSGAVRIVNAEEGLIPIKYKKMSVLKHNIGHNIKYTPCFENWGCELVIEYDANNISAQDIYTLLNYAGHYIGVGAWRPTCRDGGSGEYGTFEVAKSA